MLGFTARPRLIPEPRSAGGSDCHGRRERAGNGNSAAPRSWRSIRITLWEEMLLGILSSDYANPLMNLSPYEKWTPAHIHFLMDGKPPESRFLDYKESLPSDEVELLKDVSAFANTQGGAIVYGIREDNTVPTEIAPLSVIDEDKTLNQLSNWIRANLDPNLSEFYFDLIEVKSGKVVVLRIPQSSNAPHMIAKGSAKFYSRGAAGNTPMDSFEIRSAFLASESLVEKVNAFREHRAVTIGDNALPFNLIERSIAVLHIIPLSAFQRPHNFSIAELRKALGDSRPPGSTLGHNRDVCLEGALNVASESAKGDAISYALLFRTGVFEAVYPWGYTLPQTGKRYIKEYPVVRSFAYLSALSLLGITPTSPAVHELPQYCWYAALSSASVRSWYWPHTQNGYASLASD